MKNKMIWLLGFILALPSVFAFELRSTFEGNINLWDALVVNAFGNYWITVFMILLITLIILMLGGISWVTAGIYLQVFLLALVLGYGNQGIATAITFAAVAFLMFQLWRTYVDWRGG